MVAGAAGHPPEASWPEAHPSTEPPARLTAFVTRQLLINPNGETGRGLADLLK